MNIDRRFGFFKLHLFFVVVYYLLLTYSPALMAWGFQDQAAIALEERLTSPTLITYLEGRCTFSLGARSR